jgi:hypothetical protein
VQQLAVRAEGRRDFPECFVHDRTAVGFDAPCVRNRMTIWEFYSHTG